MDKARRLLTHGGPLLLIALALAASLVFGFIPAVMRLHLEHRAVSYDPRLVDVLSLALNAALLIALVWVGRHHRDPREADE